LDEEQQPSKFTLFLVSGLKDENVSYNISDKSHAASEVEKVLNSVTRNFRHFQ